MKKIVIFFVICFTVLILTGCDPIKLLTVKAAPNTQVIIYKKGQNIEADTAKNIILVPENGTVEQQFYFGLGTWPEKAIINYSASLDSIVFYNKDEKTKLTNQTDIQNYLMKQRRGLFKSNLIIEST